MLKKIFEPGLIGTLEIKNRLIVPPMLTEYASEDGRLTERYISYYEEKAKGGWGLIICEDNAVDIKGVGFKSIPGVWSDEIMAEHTTLVERVHEAGAKIAVQLYHAGRQSHSSLLGEKPVAPSAIQDPVMGETPRALLTEEIKDLVEKYAQAARRSKEAGYDAVELHGAHGYLINQFVSPFSNKRTDQYGGTLHNRLRFPLEIIKRVKELVGEEYPIIYRISAEELVEGGLTIEDTKTIAMFLEEAGVSAIHASGGVYKSSATLCAPTAVQTAIFSDYAKEIKKVVNIPVLTVNKIVYPEVAEALLREEKADFVSMGRASIADPYLPVKAMEGRHDEILHCIGCRQGCWDHLLQNKPVSCLVNPLTGKSGQLIEESLQKKKVMVIGGGPVGMEAAIVAAKRGHEVTLYEKEACLGGQWLLAAVPPGKELLNTLTVWQKGELARQGVHVELNVEVTEGMIKAQLYDHIIIATGSTPITPGIKGVDKKHVFTANEVLKGEVDLAGRIVVIGGGLVGVETAEHIAVHNQNVTLIEMAPEIAGNMEGGSKHFLLKSLLNNKVDIRVKTKVIEITEGEMVIETDDGLKSIKANQVVLAIGSRSERGLEKEFNGTEKVDVIGDASIVGKALDGMAKAYEVAVAI